MRTYRILCVSANKASERMWEDYAEDHGGIVLRVNPTLRRIPNFSYSGLSPTTIPGRLSTTKLSAF